jgi:predicted MPP superfamily phosphohydrolase/ABC-type oligopeptide transport system ATPase subunit
MAGKMNLGIVQLSDLHISSVDNSFLSRAEAIRRAIQPRIPSNCALILTYTGDIAFSGALSEYKIADQFLKDVLSEIGKIPGVQILGTVVVPGNHDCNFLASGDARPVLISSVASSLATIALDGESIQQLLKVQDEFFEFERRISLKSSEFVKDRLSWSTSYDHSGRRIIVRCLNTALSSRLKEQPGQLYFPQSAIPEADAEADFAITILHHPYGWLMPDNSRELRRRIESISDLVLTGHEHDGDSFTRVDRAGQETGYVEGSALQMDGETGFNFILINLEESTNQIFRYRWTEDIYEPSPSEARIFTRKYSLIESRFENNPVFSKKLNEAGTGFSHPSNRGNRELTLKELYVYPELKFANAFSKNQHTIQSSNVPTFVYSQDYLQIAGAPTSGKSTLARALYVDLQSYAGLVPVLLDGRNIKGASRQDLERAVEGAFSEQYRAPLFERFRQFDKDKKVLLIDDWHRCRFSAQLRKKIIDTLRLDFGRVIVFSDDVSLFQLLADAGKGGGSSAPEYCEIKQFGYHLRSELIRKWHVIGTEAELDDLELTSRISTSENLLDTLVRKGIVPSWPLFILSVLQTSSLATEDTASYGSYGHLYEALLTKRMASAGKKKSTLGLKYTYLSMIAYDMFVSGRNVLTEAEVREVHKRYERDYDILVDQKELWAELAAAHVLTQTGEEFQFQYKYAYYFSVAKYFQQGIGNVHEAESLRSQLSAMVACVHDEDSAHILIFYIYLTKDRQIIDQLLVAASRIYSEKERVHLTTDIDFVNNLRSRSPDVLIAANNVDNNRKERRSKMDESEAAEENKNVVSAKTAYSDTISDALKIEFAFKCLQVMGQVVKNFPLDLKGDLKLDLMQQSYDLTLRTLRSFLNIIELNVSNLLGLFDNAFRMYQPLSKKSDEEVRDASKAVMVRLTEFCIFGIIKRLSLAVGVVDLKETYRQVKQLAGEGDVPTRLIDLSIKLDHFGYIPEREVEDLELQLRNNITAYTILKLLIADFIQLFPCSYQVEQRMVQLFKFKPHIAKLGDKKVKKLKA